MKALPNSAPAVGEPFKQGWARFAENLRFLESEALEVRDEPELAARLAELASRCEALCAESFPCDPLVLEQRKKRLRLERELAEVS
jgi:hypothetical protein